MHGGAHRLGLSLAVAAAGWDSPPMRDGMSNGLVQTARRRSEMRRVNGMDRANRRAKVTFFWVDLVFMLRALWAVVFGGR